MIVFIQVCQSTEKEEEEYVEGDGEQTRFLEFLRLHEIPGFDKVFNEIVAAIVW